MDKAPKAPDDVGDGPDLFAGHLNFLERYGARRAKTLVDRLTLTPIEPMGARVDEAIDFDALEAIASWQGLFRSPRDKESEELDPEVEAQMKHCMPQFHLRNIGRAERIADPEGDLELDHDAVTYGLHAQGVRTEPLGRYRAPELLKESNLEAVRNYQRRMRWLVNEADWTRYISRELRESVRGPLWRYDPDAEEESP